MTSNKFSFGPSKTPAVSRKRLAKFALSLVVYACLSCQGQSAADLNNTARLKRVIRSHFNVRPNVEITLGARAPSEFTGYEVLPVTLSDGQRSEVLKLLISKDGKLLRVQPIEDAEEKISLSGRPVRGSEAAKVTIVVFDDLQCPYCGRNHAQLFGPLMNEYMGKIRVIYKDYPLYEIHPWARHAAVDSLCLAAQSSDAYWDYVDYAHSSVREITGQVRPLAEQVSALDKAAADIGQKRNLNGEDLAACIKKQDEAGVDKSLEEGNALSVSATPTMFINGERVEGAATLDELRQIIDRDLRELGDVPPSHATKAPQANSQKE